MTDPMVQIARDMRALEPETRKAIRPKLREAGRILAQEAKNRSSWSSRIPNAIKVQSSFRRDREGVTVRVDAKKAPHARPFEGMTSRGNSFRHPVFGRDVWVAQATRPFLLPAAEAVGNKATAAMQEALSEASISLGFR